MSLVTQGILRPVLSQLVIIPTIDMISAAYRNLFQVSEIE
jgi:hypothetical protein